MRNAHPRLLRVVVVVIVDAALKDPDLVTEVGVGAAQGVDSGGEAADLAAKAGDLAVEVVHLAAVLFALEFLEEEEPLGCVGNGERVFGGALGGGALILLECLIRPEDESGQSEVYGESDNTDHDETLKGRMNTRTKLEPTESSGSWSE